MDIHSGLPLTISRSSITFTLDEAEKPKETDECPDTRPDDLPHPVLLKDQSRYTDAHDQEGCECEKEGGLGVRTCLMLYHLGASIFFISNSDLLENDHY